MSDQFGRFSLPADEPIVYVALDSSGLVKVGATDAPRERIKALCYEVRRRWGCGITWVSWHPSSHAYEIESEVHRRLRLSRTVRDRTREWYVLELPDIDGLPALIRAIDARIARYLARGERHPSLSQELEAALLIHMEVIQLAPGKRYWR